MFTFSSSELYSMFDIAREELPKLTFKFPTETAVFSRGYRISKDDDSGDIKIYNVRSSNFYSNVSDGELDVLLEHGFKKGTAILQLFKCKDDIEQVIDNKRLALELNNSPQAVYFDRKRKRLLKKCQSIEKFLEM